MNHGPSCIFILTISSPTQKSQREQLKSKWLTLGDEDKEPYEKKTRDHLEIQGLMKECIVDALRKAKGGNCSRSYSSLAKVITRNLPLTITLTLTLNFTLNLTPTLMLSYSTLVRLLSSSNLLT